MNNTYAIFAIVTCALVTMLLRFLPFIVFQNRTLPKYISYLGKVLPFAIMAMLVVYCLKGVNLLATPFGIPEFISCLIVVAIHIWKRNTLLSILVGTIAYMLFIQCLFI